MDPLSFSLSVSGAGLRTQGERMRIVSENLANVHATGDAPGADAFRRKLIVLGEKSVGEGRHAMPEVRKITRDPSPFRVEYDPAHPAADAKGQVLYPNVNPLIELADMRESSRVYEANLQMIKQARQMIDLSIGLLRQ